MKTFSGISISSLRRLFAVVIITVMAFGSATARNMGSNISYPDETLNYKVMFKWGLINKKAGEASLSLRHNDTEYVSTLTARSMPWADRIFRVRDTLNGRMTRKDFLPLMYEKIAHEGDDHKHDLVTYSRKGSGAGMEVTGYCSRKVFKKGKLKVDERRELTATGTTVDMLTSFYFMRSLPFETWQPGHKESVNIFSGKRKETLTIIYEGKVDLEIDHKAYPCYHITFIFTSAGGKKTSDDMDAWISADSARIPLRMEGKLPVGKVHCIYTGSN